MQNSILQILVVDDDEDWRDRLCMPLKGEGHQVVFAPSHKIARKLLEEQSFDLAVVNILLRGQITDGWKMDWTNLMYQAANRGVNVIVVTAMDKAVSETSVQEIMDLSLEYGARKVLFKATIDTKALMVKVQEIADQKRSIAKVRANAGQKERGLSSPSPDSSCWDRWQWQSTDGTETILEGVIREMLASLNDVLPNDRFAETYRDQICALSSSREDHRLQVAVRLWEQWWLELPGLPYLPLLKLLATEELSGKMYSEYRDHVAHSLWVYLLGLYLYNGNRPIREAVKSQFSEHDFLCAWLVAALFHDIGYTGDKGIDQEAEFLGPLLTELQSALDFPLRSYFSARGIALSDGDEQLLAKLTGRYTPRAASLDTLAFTPRSGANDYLLDQIESLVLPTRLAQDVQTTPLRNYYRFCQTVKPNNRERFRDHGILSALILLHQFSFLDLCLTNLKEIELPSTLSRSARDALSQAIAGPVTAEMQEIVRRAAAAIALHNVDVKVAGLEKAKQEPFCLSLEDFRISLSENPLAFLLALTDVLQCWDRPKRRYVDTPLDLAIRSQDVRIYFDGDSILWAVRPRHNGKLPLEPSTAITDLSKYLALDPNSKGISDLLREVPFSSIA